MEPEEFRTEILHGFLDRLQAGDTGAYDELIRRTEDRLRLLVQRMLRHYPAVRRWDETQDVLQGALLRLFLDLRDKQKRPPSVRDFFNLASSRIRSVLKDLHRHYQGPQGIGRNQAKRARPNAGTTPDQAPGDDELERWCAFHEAVGRLDATEREVVSLIYYHGWTQAEVAELMGVSDRMVRKHWTAACARLKEMLGDSLPEW